MSFQGQVRFTVLQIMTSRDREHEFFQHKAGALDEQVWLSYREVTCITLEGGVAGAQLPANALIFSSSGWLMGLSATPRLNDAFTRFGTWG